jgi:cell fate regulator YaaT (PSP1 superfamily)
MERNIKTLDVSVIGSEIPESYFHPKLDNFKLGEFLWVKLENENYEKLVKVRGINQKVSKEIKKIVSYRRAYKDNIIKVMKNMIKGILWEMGYENVKLANFEIDVDKGILKVDYISDKKLNLHLLGSKFAKLLHVRVELNQIGARDLAGQIGWLEPCGLIACCKTFLKGKLPSISIDMARRQYLFTAPERLTGACGRLFCCLAYEFEFYDEIYNKLPKMGAKVKTPTGIGEIVEVNPLKGYFRVKYNNIKYEVINIEENKEWYIISEPEIGKDISENKSSVNDNGIEYKIN